MKLHSKDYLPKILVRHQYLNREQEGWGVSFLTESYLNVIICVMHYLLECRIKGIVI